MPLENRAKVEGTSGATLSDGHAGVPCAQVGGTGGASGRNKRRELCRWREQAARLPEDGGNRRRDRQTASQRKAQVEGTGGATGNRVEGNSGATGGAGGTSGVTYAKCLKINAVFALPLSILNHYQSPLEPPIHSRRLCRHKQGFATPTATHRQPNGSRWRKRHSSRLAYASEAKRAPGATRHPATRGDCRLRRRNEEVGTALAYNPLYA